MVKYLGLRLDKGLVEFLVYALTSVIVSAFVPTTVRCDLPPPPPHTHNRIGTLKVGDRILKINDVDIPVLRASQVDALSLLKSSEDTCTLEIEMTSLFMVSSTNTTEYY